MVVFRNGLHVNGACSSLGEQFGDRPGAVRETINSQAQMTGDAQPCVTDRGAIGTLQVPPIIHACIGFTGQNQWQIKILVSGPISQPHPASDD